MASKATKIIELRAENIKRLKAVYIRADGKSVVIGGKNAAGKSSVLDAIMLALAGGRAACTDPIRHGERKALTRVRLDNGLTVERSYTKSGSYLEVTVEDDIVVRSPQAMLDKLCGTLAFDPLAFIAMTAKQQADTLRVLAGIDFAELDRDRAVAFSDRTVANREAKSARARLDAMPEYMVPADAEGASDLYAKLQEALSHNEGLTDLQKIAESTDGDLTRCEATIARLEADLVTAKESWNTLNIARGAAVKAVTDYGPAIDVSDTQAKLEAASETQRQIDANAARAVGVEEVRAAEDAAEALDDKVKACDAAKAKAIEEASLPVAGLLFDDDEALFNGVPLAQASSAEQLLLSLEITAALDPELRVVLVHDASLLDDENMKVLADFAEKRDYQVWIERVGTGDECTVIIEDGSVKA